MANNILLGLHGLGHHELVLMVMLGELLANHVPCGVISDKGGVTATLGDTVPCPLLANTILYVAVEVGVGHAWLAALGGVRFKDLVVAAEDT